MSKDSYRRLARFYDALCGPVNAGLKAVGTRLCPPRAGIRVLEVGCGTGSNLEPYQRAGCEVFGIDTSPSMLAVARRKLAGSATLILGDASAMPFGDRTFGLILASLTLHEMRPMVRDGVMREMGRTLEPEGRVLLIDFHPGSLRFPKGFLQKGVITVVERAAGREHFRNYRDFLARDGLRPLCENHGLVVHRQRTLAGGTIALISARPRG